VHRSHLVSHGPDPYEMLGIEPGSPPAIIKKAWRKLVQQYHPDKLNAEGSARDTFLQIQTAYETLTNPAKKEKYLQERWLFQVTRENKLAHPTDARSFLQACIRLEQRLHQQNVFRLDTDYLLHYLLFLLSPAHLSLLNNNEEAALIKESTRLLLECTRLLPTKQQLVILPQLALLPGKEASITVEAYKVQMHWQWQLERYRIVLLVALVVLLCGLIVCLAR
jgi:hypothetical protein